MDRNRLIASLFAPTAALIALACSDSGYEPLVVEGAGGTTPGTGGAGATPTTGGDAATGGDATTGGDAATGGTTSNPDSELGTATQTGSGKTMAQYQTASDLLRDGVPYALITNGWGPGFESHTISWLGTSFTVEAFTGTAGSNGEPAGYPTVYCGRYSNGPVPDCGLPAPIASTGSVRTGWRWAPNGNAGAYNAAYDIWMGDGSRLQSYLMVWLRDPPRFQPAGSRNSAHQDVTVANTPGVWDLFTGTVNGLPIVNYVQPEGSDLLEIEFDVLDFVADAQTRGLTLPGTHVNAVAVGFEIWEGPINGLETLDFYVDVS